MTVAQSFNSLRHLVHSTITDADADNGMKFSMRRTELQRFWCSDHGTVVPLDDRYDCPYCMPNDEYLERVS